MANKKYGQEFQVKMLAICVREPLFLALYKEALQPAIFSSNYLRDVCSFILSYYDKFKLPPTHSALTELVREQVPITSPLLSGYALLLNQIFTIDLSDAAYVQEQVTTAARHLAVRRALDEMDEANEQLEFDKLQPLLDAALRTGAGIGDLGLELTKDGDAALIKFGRLEANIETGFTRLQRAIGGFCTGEETIIAAPPNMGKTALLGNLAYGAARNDNGVMYYTLEIGAERMLCRFLAKMTVKPTAELQDITQLGRNVRRVRRVLKHFRLTSNGTIYVKHFPARTATVDSLRAHLAMVNGQDVHPKLIIVDYADLIRPSRKDGKTYETLRETCEELRAMADEFAVHLITASQSTRNSLYAEIIDLDDLAESWGKAQTADTIVALCQTAQEAKAEVARLFVAKARNETRGGTVHLKTNYRVLDMREVDEEEHAKRINALGYEKNDGKKPKKDGTKISFSEYLNGPQPPATTAHAPRHPPPPRQRR